MSLPDADPADIATLVVLRCDAQRRLTVRWSWPGEPDSIVDLTQVGVSGPPNHAAGWYAYELALAGHLGGMAHSEAEWQVDWELAMAILRD